MLDKNYIYKYIDKVLKDRGSKTLFLNSIPNTKDGRDGDFALHNTPEGANLYVKHTNKWWFINRLSKATSISGAFDGIPPNAEFTELKARNKLMIPRSLPRNPETGDVYADSSSQEFRFFVDKTTGWMALQGSATSGSKVITYSSEDSGTPIVVLENKTHDSTNPIIGAEIRFKTTHGGNAGVDGDDLGRITFYGNDDAGSPNNQQFAEILVESTDTGSGSEEATMTFKIAEYDGTLSNGLTLIGSPSTDTAVNVILGSSQTSRTTSKGSFVIGDGDAADQVLIFNHASVDATIGIDHSAASAGASPFAIRVGGTAFGTPNSFEINSGSTESTFNTDLTITSSTASKPIVTIENTADDATSGELKFNNTRSGEDAGLLDDLGRITFYGQNNDDISGSLTNLKYAEIIGETKVVADGSEGGQLRFQVASHDGSMVDGLVIKDGSQPGEIDIDIGATATSVTTVAGTAEFGGNVTYNGGHTIYNGTGTDNPSVAFQNITDNAFGPTLTLYNSKGGAIGDGNDDCGTIKFDSRTDNTGSGTVDIQTYASILGEIVDPRNTQEGGRLTLNVASHNGDMATGLKIEDGNDTAELDVTVGSGSSSLTTTTGNILVSGGNVKIDGAPGILTLKEGNSGAAGLSALADYGKVWVNNSTPTTLCYTDSAASQDDLGSAQHFIPINNLLESSSTGNEYQMFIAPFNMVLDKVVVRCSEDISGADMTIGMWSIPGDGTSHTHHTRTGKNWVTSTSVGADDVNTIVSFRGTIGLGVDSTGGSNAVTAGHLVDLSIQLSSDQTSASAEFWVTALFFADMSNAI